MNETRSRVPLERDKNGARILTHGEGGYKRGCGCDDCMAGHAEAERDRRAARTAAKQQAEAGARAAAGLPPEEGALRTTAKSYLSREGAEALNRHLAETGQTEGGYLRGLVYDAIGFDDAARRDGRPPRRERAAAARAAQNLPPDESGQVIEVTAILSREGKAALGEYVAGTGQTEAGFIRDLVHEATGFEDMARRDGRSSRRPARSRHSKQAGSETTGQEQDQ